MRSIFEPVDLLFEPGTAWYYSNSGYFLLGLVIEAVTGKPWAEALQEQIILPADLKETRVAWHRPLLRKRASGYDREDGSWVNAAPISMTVPYSAGALASTAPDLLHWMSAVAGGKLLTPTSFQKMIQPSPLEGEAAAHSYALGFFTGSLDGHAKISHRGDINGFAGYLSYYPNDELTIVVLTNFQGSRPDEIERRVAREALGLPWPSPESLPLSENELAAWPGTYRLGIISILISATDEGLSLAVPGLLPQPLQLLKQRNGELWLAADPDLRILLPAADESPKTGSSWARLASGDMWLVAPRDPIEKPQGASSEE
jgi:CubicO group peptidase (beta-lactamase class C family)